MNVEVQCLVLVVCFIFFFLYIVKVVNVLVWGYFKFQFIGLENVNLINFVLLVGNYIIYGMLDGLLLFEKFYEFKGIVLCFLGDYMYFKVLLWCDVLK